MAVEGLACRINYESAKAESFPARFVQEIHNVEDALFFEGVGERSISGMDRFIVSLLGPF